MKNKKDDLQYVKTSSYFTYRNYLFSKSYIVYKLRERLLTKYCLPKDLTEDIWGQYLVDNCQELYLQVFDKYGFGSNEVTPVEYYLYQPYVEDFHVPGFKALSQSLSLDKGFVRNLLLFDVTTPNSSTTQYLSNIRYAGEKNPIVEEGIYLKLDENVVEADFKKILEQVRPLSKTRIGTKPFGIRTSEEKVPLYLFVQDFLITEDSSFDISSDEKVDEDLYGKPRLRRAFKSYLYEQDIDERSEDFEKKLTVTETYYNRIVSGFRLPKFTDLPDLLHFLD